MRWCSRIPSDLGFRGLYEVLVLVLLNRFYAVAFRPKKNPHNINLNNQPISAYYAMKHLSVSTVCFLICILESTSWMLKAKNILPAPPPRRSFLPLPLKSSATLSSAPTGDGFFDTPPLPIENPSYTAAARHHPLGLLERYAEMCEARPVYSVLLARYAEMCKKKPLVTKSITSAVVSAAGNILSQALRTTFRGEALKIALPEVTTFALTGLLYVGPFYHFWYDQLWKIGDWMQNRFGSSNNSQVAGTFDLLT